MIFGGKKASKNGPKSTKNLYKNRFHFWSRFGIAFLSIFDVSKPQKCCFFTIGVSIFAKSLFSEICSKIINFGSKKQVKIDQQSTKNLTKNRIKNYVDFLIDFGPKMGSEMEPNWRFGRPNGLLDRLRTIDFWGSKTGSSPRRGLASHFG